jgi:type I restriction enzyme S subunit
MKRISEHEAFGKYKHFLLEEGDFVVSSSGTLGRIAEVHLEDLPVMLNTSTIRFRPLDDSKLDRLYLRYFLESELFQQQVKQLATGSVQLNYGPSHLAFVEMPLPPMKVQKVIGEVLENFTKAMQQNYQIARNLEEVAQTIFKSWFIDFDPVRAKMAGEEPVGMDAETAALFPDSMEESELGMIPSGWQVKPLKELLELHKKTVKAGVHTEAVPYVPIDQISPKTIFLHNSLSGELAQTSLVSFSKMDILFGAMRPYFHKVALAPFDGTTRTTTFVLKPHEEHSLCFGLFTVFQDRAIDYATNHSQGTTIPYAAWTNSFENYPYVEPSSLLMAKFDGIVRPLIEYGQSLIQQNASLSSIRDTLLPRLISGELQIPDEMLES